MRKTEALERLEMHPWGLRSGGYRKLKYKYSGERCVQSDRSIKRLLWLLEELRGILGLKAQSELADQFSDWTMKHKDFPQSEVLSGFYKAYDAVSLKVRTLFQL
jgi:hypothetical protein